MSSLVPASPLESAVENGVEGGRPNFQETLVSYNPPIRKAECPPSALKVVTAAALAEKEGRSYSPPLPKLSRSERQVADPSEVLDQIFFPRHWTEEHEEWVQTVAADYITRMDVITLQEQLDLRCQQRNALPSGVCVVREDLNEQCFDELIRQVTCLCAERGILLAKIRDEIKMTIDAYKVMYDTACQLSMRQALQLETKKSLAVQLKELEERKSVKERQLNELKAKLDGIEKREVERRQADEQRHKEEVNFLKKTNMQLTSEIKRYTG